MNAVILAGGEGTRLRPLTYEVPKPLIPVQGKPVIQYLVENFYAKGIKKIFIIIKEKDFELFRNFGIVFLKNRKIDMKRMALVIERDPLGTFGALRKVQKEIGNEDFFVTNADEVKDVNLAEMIKLHRKKGKSATIAVKKMDEKDSFGNVEYDPNTSLVKGFYEKQEGKGEYASIGMYIFCKEVFVRLIQVEEKIGKFSMVEKHLFPFFAKQGMLAGYEHKGQFFPTDDFDKYEKAILNYKHQAPKY